MPLAEDRPSWLRPHAYTHVCHPHQLYNAWTHGFTQQEAGDAKDAAEAGAGVLGNSPAPGLHTAGWPHKQVQHTAPPE
jgi:hypothetical protein